MPPIYNPPAWWTGGAPEWFESGPYKSTPQDYFQQVLYNKIIPYLDPQTQLSTAQWLARANPKAWATYSAATLPNMTTLPTWESGMVKEKLTGDYFSKVLDELNFKKLVGSLPNKNMQSLLYGNVPPNRDKAPATSAADSAAPDTQAGLDWLINALKTAQHGMPGANRNQQALAKAHLSTLYKEAQQDPGKGGLYKTLFENITNPVVKTAPLSGMFGTMRSTVPSPERKGGQAAKNPFFT